MFRAGARVAVLLAFATVASAQQAPRVIRGRVVAAEDARPLRHALISVERPRPVLPRQPEVRVPRSVLTDENGRFAITLEDASRPLTISKAGYALTRYLVGRAAPAERELEIRLPRGGVISGRVFDSNGQPGTRTRVVARSEQPGTQGVATYEAEVDDLGDYRISGIESGRYSVVAQPGLPRFVRQADFERAIAQQKQGIPLNQALLPPSSAARAADVRGGDETTSIDFEIRATASSLPSGDRIVEGVNPQTPGGPPTAWMVVPPLIPSDTDGRQPGPPGTVNLVRLNDVSVLTPGAGAISGLIVDGAGEPFQGVSVQAMHVRFENGQMMARAVGLPRTTDDRGRYRVHGLNGGEFVIAATLDAVEFMAGRTRLTGFAPVYFPGTPHVDSAQPLRVVAGADLNGADFTFAAAPTVSVVGTAVNAAGEPLVGRISLRVSHRSRSIAPDPKVVPIEKDGSFELREVPAGDYVVHAMGEATFGGPPELAWEYVTVSDRDPPPLAIKASRGTMLEGRFIVEGISEPPMRALTIYAITTDVDRSPPTAERSGVHDDGRFYLSGLFGPMRFVSRNTEPGYYLKSMTIAGVDVSDGVFDFGFTDEVITDVEVVLSPNGGRITGSITDPSLQAITGVAIAFPISRDRWFAGSRFVKRAALNADGSFEVAGLPPGEYWVAAVDAIELGEWQTPNVLDSLVSRAGRVTVAEHQAATASLRLIRR